MKIINFILPIVTILYLGCSPEQLFIEVEPAEEKLVISSQFIPDSILIVTVTRSFSALVTKSTENLEADDIEKLIVDRAFVTVTHNNETTTLYQVGEQSGIYVGAVGSISPGDWVDLFVYDSLTTDSIHSTTEAMPQVMIEEAFITKTYEGNDTTSTFHYSFNDPAGPNWYILHAYGLDDVPSVVDDSLIFNLVDQNLLITSELISDITFESDEVSREIALPFYNSPDTVVFMLTNISEGYFRFLDARQRTGGIIASATGEPVNHPTNIENGYGFFNIHLPHLVVGYNED